MVEEDAHTHALHTFKQTNTHACTTHIQIDKHKERRTCLGYWHGMEEGLGTAEKEEKDQEQGQAFGEA